MRATRWLVTAGLLAGLGACASGDDELLFQPRVPGDGEQYATMQALLNDSGVAIVVRVGGVDETLPTGLGNPLEDTDLRNAVIVDRLVGADDLPDDIRLTSLYLEDGPEGPSAPPHRIDDQLWRDDREYLLFVAPFRYPNDPWPDTYTNIGGVQGIFAREAGSRDDFRPVVPDDVAIADEVSRDDVLALTPGGHPIDPDDS